MSEKWKDYLCDGCNYARFRNAKHKECRYNPPIVIDRTSLRYPLVNGNKACSKFKRRKP